MAFEKIKKTTVAYPVITAGSISLIIGIIIGYVLHENFPERFDPVVISQDEIKVNIVK